LTLPARLKSTAMLALLTSVLPLNATLTAVALLRQKVSGSDPARAPDPKTILVSGGKMTKSLQLARSFHMAGHRVIMIEAEKYRLTGHRFSRAVDRFYTVPKPDRDGYTDALVEIVIKEGVDVYVPVCAPAASVYDSEAMAALEEHCEVLHFDPATIARLDDKGRFAEEAEALGLSTPDAVRITDPRQVLDFDFSRSKNPYILKSIPYDPLYRLDLTRLPRESPAETEAFVQSLPISEEKPWVLQEFIEGQEYCTHSTVRRGRVQLHCCCESSAFQINYEMVDRPEIEDWVKRFVEGLDLTGQVSLDFIANGDSVYAIECNPRTHSAITMFYDHPGVAASYLEDGVDEIRPTDSSRPTYWLYHELWRLAREPSSASRRIRTIARGKDAIFQWDDPLPFLMVHHLQIPSLLIESLRQGTDWIKLDFNIGKLVEAGGD